MEARLGLEAVAVEPGKWDAAFKFRTKTGVEVAWVGLENGGRDWDSGSWHVKECSGALWEQQEEGVQE